MEWGVLDTRTNEYVERAGTTEKYPEVWAHKRAKQLNDQEKDSDSNKRN